METKLQPTYYNGLKAGIPIALGYFVVSFTFGMTGVLMGIAPHHLIIMSMTNLTSAGQFACVNLLSQGALYAELMVTVLLINIRYLLMSTALSQKLEKNVPFYKRLIMSAGITDETFSLALVEVETISFGFFMGLLTLPYLGWAAGTALGSLMDNVLDNTMQSAASIALYCMFIAIVLPSAKHHRDIRFAVVLTLVIKLLFLVFPLTRQLTAGYSIILSAIIAASIAAVIFPHSPDTERLNQG